MKKNAVRILSAVLAAVMLLTLANIGAFAADNGVIKGTFTYMPAFTDESETDTFYYRDSYFEAASTVQNPHLTSMSMVLSLASMEIEGSSYITDLFTKIGFTDIQIDDMNKTPTKDTIGTAIAHKRIGSRDIVAVAVRGNKYGAEWAANLTAGAEGNIAGFEQPAQKVIARIKAYIADHGLSNIKLWAAGYSRAGAITDLTGVYVNEHLDEFSVTADDAYFYTFEAPRCCASSKVYPNIFCVKNKNDIITYIYPEKWELYTNGVDIVIGTDMTVKKVKIDVLSEDRIIELGEMPMDEFNEEFVSFLADELTREKYSGEFDSTAAALLELFFSKPTEQWMGTAIMGYMRFANIESNPRLMYILLNEVMGGVLQHNSDAMYRQLSDEIVALIRETATARQLMMSDEEYEAVLSGIYPLLRKLGPVLIKDYYYRDGVDYSAVLPENYDDPDYDPQTSEPRIPTYDQYLEASQNQPGDPVEQLTDAEKGEEDGRARGYCDGEEDALAGREARTEAPMPDDAAERSQEYIDAYLMGYMDSYQFAYRNTVEEMNEPQKSEEYQAGAAAAAEQAEIDAMKDALAGSYKASFNEDPPAKADGGEYSEDFINGYRDSYAEEYDSYYTYYEGYYKELNFFHFGTLYANYEEIFSQHYPQVNFALIKAMDPYYSAAAVLLGDVDGDGEVTILDATAIQRRLADMSTDSFVEAAADADGDGEISILDATEIQRWLAALPANNNINKPITV